MKRFLLKVLVISICLITIISLMACESKKVKVVEIGLSEEKICVAVKKDNGLLASVNQFLTAKKNDINEIIDKFMDASEHQLNSYVHTDITINPTDTTNMNSQLGVLVNFDYKPFEYSINRDDLSAGVGGIDIEIALLLADYLDMDLVIYTVEYDDLFIDLSNTATFDIALSAITATAERATLVDFSNPYFESEQKIITRKDCKLFNDCETAADVEKVLAELSGPDANCGAQDGTTAEDYLEGTMTAQSKFKNLNCTSYTRINEAMDALVNKEITFIVVDGPTAEALVNQYNK